MNERRLIEQWLEQHAQDGNDAQIDSAQELGSGVATLPVTHGILAVLVRNWPAGRPMMPSFGPAVFQIAFALGRAYERQRTRPPDYIETCPEHRHPMPTGSLVNVEDLYRERGDFYLCPREIREKAAGAIVLLLMDCQIIGHVRVWVRIVDDHPGTPLRYQGVLLGCFDGAPPYRFNPEHIVRFLQ